VSFVIDRRNTLKFILITSTVHDKLTTIACDANALHTKLLQLIVWLRLSVPRLIDHNAKDVHCLPKAEAVIMGPIGSADHHFS